MCLNECQMDVRAKLIEYAKQEELVSFGEVGDWVGVIARDVARQLLNPINEAEHSAGRPLLSSIVVNKRTQRPGCGFFIQARQLGVADRFDSDEDFWKREAQRVFDTFRS